jgi:light-regulated signal transduction histidine kinase (bacteriophytochrome)
LEQFVNIASHDLQEPLRTISSFMQLLRQRYAGQLDDKADTFINYAVEGTIHMQKLINDLLAFSRVGGGELRVEPIDLQSVLDNMLLNLKAAIEENQAEIIIDNLPVIYADEAQVAQLLQNLIANSLKFRGEEAPRIRIFSERKKNEIVICVRDNGIGIDPQHVDRIFLIFQRLHRRGVYPGTGIGLAICKKIVERHGGRIWVESTTDQGSLFCFTLPEKKDNDNE